MNIFRYSQHQIYDTRTYILNYDDINYRIVKVKYNRIKGFEEICKRNFNTNEKNNEEIQRISLSRTKKNIRELALCNKFTYFATLTINNQYYNRYDIDLSQNELKKRLKKIKRNNAEFIYLFITEKHKDNAYHFHGLIGGILEEDFFYKNKNNYLSNKIFDELGFNSFSKIENDLKVSNYITKYITKDCVKNKHNQIYIRSKGLSFANKELIKNLDFKPTFENDFVSIKDINLNNCSLEDKLLLSNAKNLKITL